MTRCASELALEAYLVDPSRSAVRPHLDACGACRSRIARMEREGDEFRRFVHPRTVDRVVANREPPRPGWARLLLTVLPAGGLAAVAANLFLTPQPPAGYVGAKGPPLSLRVWAGTADGAREVADGDRIPAAALLRFQVASGRPCRLWLLSVDGRGEVSRLYPAPGDAPAAVSGEATLPGSVALDGLAGPERLYAVCSEEEIPLELVERSVHGIVAGEAALRRGSRLQGLPAGIAQATMLVEKVP